MCAISFLEHVIFWVSCTKISRSLGEIEKWVSFSQAVTLSTHVQQSSSWTWIIKPETGFPGFWFRPECRAWWKRASSGNGIARTSHGHTPTPSEVVISLQDTLGNVMTWLTKTGSNEIFLFTINIAFLNTECFKCPQPTFRRPRCPATSDFCDGNSVSSTATSYAEQVTPYSVTVTELPLTLCFIHDISLNLFYTWSLTIRNWS